MGRLIPCRNLCLPVRGATAVTLKRLPRLARDDKLGKLGTHEGPSDLDLLRHGELLSCHLTRRGSNSTCLAGIALGGRYALAIYKFRQGKWTLWDFPSCTLYKLQARIHRLPAQTYPGLGLHPADRHLGRAQAESAQSRSTWTIVRGELLTPSRVRNRATATPIICALSAASIWSPQTPSAIRSLSSAPPYGELWGTDHRLTFHSDT